MKRIYPFLIIFLALVSCSPKKFNNNVLTEKERWEQHASNTEIIRDNFGIPHIYGKTDADAVFGLLYAQCEDDFNRVEQNYIWAIGRLAEIEGEDALYSDLRARLFMTQKEAEENYEKSPEWLKKLCTAFADGVNYYLYKNTGTKPRLIDHFEPWMPMYFSEGSIGGDIEIVSTNKIMRFYKKSTDSILTTINNGLIGLDDNEPRGSNGFAVSGKLTRSGNAMLLINPHTSFFFRGEAHVVSEEGLNAYGAVTWGQFFVYQGFNDKTGWMHTSTGSDVIDEFEETIIKNEKGLVYKYGTEFRDVESSKVVLKYKTDKGIKDRIFTTFRTHHGPITHSDNGKWVATAMMWSPVKALEQSFIRTKNSDHKEFHKMMDIRTNSSNNTVYADADGIIAYYHGNFIPKRDTLFDYSKPVDGSNPKTDWKGFHSLEDNIFVMNPKNGWIQNCNSSPFTCAGKYSPKREDYPGYMTSFPDNFRAIHAIQLLKKAKDLTLDKLITLAYDPYLPGADLLINALIEAYDKAGYDNKDVKESMAILKNWDFKVSKESKAMTISHFYLNAFIEKGGGRETFFKNLDKMNYMISGSSYKERIEIFHIAMQKLKEDLGSVTIEWGKFNRYQRNNGDIKQKFDDSLPSIAIGMTSSYWGALAAYGVRKGKGTKYQYGVGGNSFVAVVEFGEKVKAKSLLVGGQSGDSSLPHFNDQMQLYAKGKFKPVAYYREDVLKRAENRYHPGNKKQKLNK